MAQMWTCIIKNEGASPVTIDDLGITIDATAQIDFHELFDFTRIADSNDLRDYVSAGTLVVNDGTSDLDTSDGVDFLAIVHVYYLGSNYYTKTQLQTSGQASVHWDNITNAPAFGSFYWLDPAIARIIQFSSDPPGGPSEGDFYVDTDDDHLYKYVSSSWVDQGAPATGDRVIDLDSTSQAVYEYSGSWALDTTPDEGSAIIITDDGDSKSAMYTYTSADVWVKIADVDLLGGSLQSAYNNGTTITVTNILGPVIIDASSSTTSALSISPVTNAPVTSLTDGDIANIDGRMYMYDSTAAMFMSFDRPNGVFGKRGNVRNQFLELYISGLTSNNTGIMVPEDAVITKIWGILSAAGITDIYIYKNDNFVTPIATLSFSATDKEVLRDLNLSLTSEDHLAAYSENAVNIVDPVITLEFAYRK